MTEPRAYTADEACDQLLDQIRGLARYWAAQPDKTPQERCDGLAFSILTLIDGQTTSNLPAITLVLEPHPDDKEFYRAEGENWYEEGMAINTDCMLHDNYYPPLAKE